MQRSQKKIRIGIVGCGAIGSRIAKSVNKELRGLCELSGVYDCISSKADDLARRFAKKRLAKTSLTELIKSCDLMVEAVNATETKDLISQALRAKKHVLAMSVGKILNEPGLFKLAAKNRCSVLIPSGAVAGLDAIKAASLVALKHITLTTRKPPSGFANLDYVKKQGIDLANLTGETVLFEGSVDEAIKLFPQNINVAATVALASQAKAKITVRIITSPNYTKNMHEIECAGDFGRMISRTENVVCPDNPKTSYLAVLSGIQTLKDFCRGTRIGT